METETTILTDLITYLGVTSDSVLSVLVKNAIKNTVNKRYPFGFTNEQKANCVDQYSTVIFNAALYAYNQQGAEFQNSHSENGIARTWVDEDSLYSDVVPIVKIL